MNQAPANNNQEPPTSAQEPADKTLTDKEKGKKDEMVLIRLNIGFQLFYGRVKMISS